MRYFKAFPHDQKPYIIFNQWAASAEELEKIGAENDPLILPEKDLPQLVNGVYNIKIVDGQLVARSQAELDGFEADYLQYQKLLEYQNRPLDTETFSFDGQSFPMHQIARYYYSCLTMLEGNQKVQSTTEIYTLTAEQRSDFLLAYKNRLKELTQPIIS